MAVKCRSYISCMKKFVVVITMLVISTVFIAWGPKGHRVISIIAQKHFTDHTAKVVAAYLSSESIADASTWADENRTDENAIWHFINLPAGLTYTQFEAAVKQSSNNVYTAILKAEADLANPTLPASQKKTALRFLVHLVGDAHQPMHVSRAADKGGNLIKLYFNGGETNLHSLFDGKLIEYENLKEADMVKTCDVATPAEIKSWQKDAPIQWLWESYQLSNQLYNEIKSGQTIGKAAFNKYMPLLRRRINQAGIRLAAELNRILADQQLKKLDETKVLAPVNIKLAEAKESIGKLVTVTGKIYSTKDIGNALLVNLGGNHPDQLLTLAVKGRAKSSLQLKEGTKVTATGKIIKFKGKPEIIISQPGDLQIVP